MTENPGKLGSRESKPLRLPYFLVLGFSVTTSATVLTAQQDCADAREVENIERAWITAADRPREWVTDFFERVLADDEVHILANGRRLTKADELNRLRQRPRAGTGDTSSVNHISIEEMRVRLYGEIAIVNGTTITRTGKGDLVRRIRFSDVFQKRYGRWQAINLQETLLEGSLD